MPATNDIDLASQIADKFGISFDAAMAYLRAGKYTTRVDGSMPAGQNVKATLVDSTAQRAGLRALDASMQTNNTINALVRRYGLPPNVAAAYVQSVMSGKRAAAAEAAHPVPSGHVDLTDSSVINLGDVPAPTPTMGMLTSANPSERPAMEQQITNDWMRRHDPVQGPLTRPDQLAVDAGVTKYRAGGGGTRDAFAVAQKERELHSSVLNRGRK